MIVCTNIRLTYRKKEILQGVDFTALPGQITVLLGRNGSGKSSLLRCIAGNRHHHTGEILLDGHSAAAMLPVRRARLLAVMPQTLTQPPIRVEEMLALGRVPHLGYGGRLSAADQERIQTAMERTGILTHRSDRVSSLSGGERQLAFFTLLLVQDAPNLLLDEPTANLDAEYRQTVYTVLRQMREQGRTIALVMHDLTDAMELADKIYVLDHGQVRFCGTPGEFAESGVPEKVFGLTPIKITDEKHNDFTVFRLCENPAK